MRPAERVADLADREGVDMRFYNVIYDEIDDIENALKGMLKPEYEEVELGSAEHHRLQRAPRRAGRRSGRPRGRGHALLQRDLRRDR